MSTTSKNNRAPRRRNRNGRNRPTQAMVNAAVKSANQSGLARQKAMGGQKPRRRRNRRGRNRNGFGRGIPGPQKVLTSASFMGGPIIRNVRKMSKPEPFEGDELIATVLGSVAFATTQFSIQPANSTTFPWFNKIAQLYERYKFTFLEFYFQHDVSQFATQGQTGLVLLSALYDAASAAPTTKTQIEATDPHVISMPNENSCLDLSVQGMHPVGEPKFCRIAGLPGAADIKTYDAGNLFVTTQGMANASEVGELHVRYRGLLYDRILDSSAASAPSNFSVSNFQGNSPQVVVTATPTTLTLPLAATNGLGIVNTAGSMVPPAGNYLLDFYAIIKDSAAEAYSCIIDIQKNGTSIWTVTTLRPVFVTGVSAGANEEDTIPATAFVSANGTDAFTVVATATGAAGTLTVSASLRWVAI
jgi:hypothetical protein